MAAGRRACRIPHCALVLAAALLVGCGHTAKLRPAPQGQVLVDVEVGGPFARVGKDLALLPLSAVGASWGVADRSSHRPTHASHLCFVVGCVRCWRGCDRFLGSWWRW